MDLSLRWLMTATLCFMYISLVLTLEKRGALNSITRKSFNAVTTGISIALGLDIASALKDMASIMRWYVLTNRTYNLVEVSIKQPRLGRSLIPNEARSHSRRR